MIIVHNMLATFTERQLKITDKDKNQALERLSSGYRINKTADDSAGLSISEEMRAQIRGLTRASANIYDGISLTNIADGAIHEIHSILQRVRELMVQSANDTNCDEDRIAIEEEVTALNNELDRMFDETEFNTIKIFQGRETVLKGPDINVQTVTQPDIEKKNQTSKATVVWIPKEDIAQNGDPQDEIDTTTTVKTRYHSSYTENETLVPDDDDPMHPAYEENTEYELTTTTTTTVSEKSTTYERLDTDPSYTTLQEPGKMVGNNGYINVKNVARDLDLSCAMSQLGIEVDGVVLGVDIYSSGNVTRNTVVSPDNSTATTTFSLNNLGIELDQIITLSADGKSYSISYAIRNTDSTPHDITVRLAFDVMNLDSTHAASTTDGTGAFPYTLENADATIPVSATGVTDACLTDISDLYGVMDKSKVNMNKSNITHTGVGLWWETTAGAGSSINLGSVTYGPIELKKIPYRKTVGTKDDITISEETTTITTKRIYKPSCLDIQAGANSFQMIPIRLWDLSTENLKCRVPTEISAFNPQDSLVHLDRIIDKISSIRSYYGAITNRMEHAYSNNGNIAENLTSSESRIRDADMAKEMVAFSKDAILQRAGQSMLAQANSSKDGILQLLR